MMMRTLHDIIRRGSPKLVIRTFLLVGALSVLAAAACSSDDPAPTATAVPATATISGGASTNGNGDRGSEMLGLPNIADTVERVRPAVVSMLTEVIIQGRRQPGFSSGTGVIFDDSGLVLTNNHVIEDGVEITVTLDDGAQIIAEVVGDDRPSDLAVLRLPGNGYTSLPLLKKASLRAGD